MYPNISNRKQTPNLYPDLTLLEENVSVPDHASQNECFPTNSSFATQSSLQKHPEIQNRRKTDPVNENKDETRNKDETTKRFWNLCKYIITILSSVLFLLIKYLYSTFQYQMSDQALPLYIKEVEKLKPSYSPQTDDFWHNIKSFPYSLLSEENPEGPAVLLMVAPAGGLNLSLQLAKQLAHILHKLLKSSSTDLHLVNGTSLTVESPDDQKMMIDKRIRTIVQNQGQKVVVVVNLEKIDPSAVMIFHAYCDNSEAVYKDIAIIFLLELPSGVYVKNDGNVYSYLSQIWGRLGKSRCQALFSRMANNIAILKAK